MSRFPARSLSVLVLACLGWSRAACAQDAPTFHFELQTLGGGTTRAADFRENVLIVDFWGTWCGPCRQAVPHLQRLYAKYKHYGLEIVGLCYERGREAEQRNTVRQFARDAGITYTLALGTPEVQQQVESFRGYPTMLFFTKGLQLDRTEVGFAPGNEVGIERWIQRALGMAVDEVEQPEEDELDEPIPQPAPADESLAIPAGVIFQPGQADKGFDFEAVDMADQRIRFKELAGKPVVLALTTTWTPEAPVTAELMNRVQDELGDEVHVLAASLEMAREDAAKRVTIRAFMDRHKVRYRVFPAGLDFQKKIHLFRGIPLFLVFDGDGTLVLREAGVESDELFEKLRQAAGR